MIGRSLRIAIIRVSVLWMALWSGSCISGNDEGSEDILRIGDTLPSLSLEMAGGTTLTDADIEGKVSVIILFTTTCPDCQHQLPVVEQIYRDYKNNPAFILFGISRADMAGSYWEDNELTFPYSPQPDRSVYERFASSIVPRIYVSDKNRVVRNITKSNPLASYGDLKGFIDPLLE